MGTINIPFEIGAKVWTPSSDHIGPEFLPCPECAGKLLHTLILGCGEKVKIKCHQCGPGYQDPCGRVRNNARLFSPREIELASVFRVEERDGGVCRVTYRDAAGSIFDDHRLFATSEQCAVKCAEENAAQAEEETRRLIANLSCGRDRASFSATYYRRHRAELKRQLAAIEERLAKTGV